MGDAGGYVFRNDSVRGVYAEINSETDLTYGTVTDSNTIYGTKGRFYLMENSFEGEGGLVSWEKTGLSVDDVFVELDKYTVALNRATIFADSVSFTNKEFFSHKLKVLQFRQQEKSILKQSDSVLQFCSRIEPKQPEVQACC